MAERITVLVKRTQYGESAAGIADVNGRRWWTLVVICLVVFILTLDNTILNVALPTLAREFGASASTQKWFVEAYVLVFAGLLLTGGALSDRFGLRRMLAIGLAIFGAASLLASFASSATLLLAGRALMGVGGALLYPGTLAVIKHTFPAHERPRAIAFWGATAGVGAAAGPVIGGWLLETFWWGAVFLVNLPVVLLVAGAGWWLLPRDKPNRSVPLDLVGTALSVAGVGGLVFAIIEAPIWGWASAAFWGLLLSAGLLLALFVWWELRTTHPLLDVRLFGNPRFSAASQAVILTYFAIAGTSFALPQYLQFVLGYGPLEAGIRTVPLALAALVSGFVAAMLIARFGTKWVIVGGLAIAASGFLLLSTLSATSGYSVLLLAQVLLGIGAMTAGTAATDSVLGAVPRDKAGSAAAVNETGIELGNALGIAGLGTVLTASYTSAMRTATDLPADLRDTAAESISTAMRLAETQGGAVGEVLAQQARAAFAGAMDQTALIGALIIGIGLLVAVFVLPAHAPTSGAAAEGAATS
jgi:EmrB/QacA subfamily drug resistance transporter